MECKAPIYALRGATTVESDNREEVIRNVKALYEAILKENELEEEDLVYIHFSQTKDIRTINAASALRASGYGQAVPLFCTQEADVENSLKYCIRVLILVVHPENKKKKMIYLERSSALRPDYQKGN